MSGTVILVTRETLGSTSPAERAFGLEMMDKLLHSLEGARDRPEAICFYTEGVRLVCHGSPTLLGLGLLAGLGVRLVACHSCLEHYGLLEAVAVGEVGNMRQIAELMLAAGKVITV